IRYLYIAYGSVCELETQILLSMDLGYVDSAVIEKIKDEIQQIERMLIESWTPWTLSPN
ncbi:MAG: four helix bundle protein, partial [Desulfobacteraceae bacterium]|nr:four helix bundle protein [Desulfobacteraceae bacterium]